MRHEWRAQHHTLNAHLSWLLSLCQNGRRFEGVNAEIATTFSAAIVLETYFRVKVLLVYLHGLVPNLLL